MAALLNQRSLIIGIGGDRIDVLLRQGSRIVAGRRLPIAAPSEAAPWRQALPRLAKLVHDAARDLKAEGAAATVLYRSPSECTEFSTLKIARPAEAVDAAILGCADALGCPLEEAVCRGLVIAQNGGEPPQSHVIVGADVDESLEAIAGLVEEAGLTFAGAVPTDALLMASVTGAAIRAGRGLSAKLYIGEQRSFFVIVADGTLRFARPISVGVAALVTCLTRPLRSTPASEPIELARTEAAAILHQFGFPKRDAIIDAERKLTGGSITPLLQPVLQRYVVELRQSLRFALSEEERGAVKVEISGPGSAIPGFAEIVLAELKLERQPSKSQRQYDWRDPVSAGGDLPRAAADERLLTRLLLQPRRLARQREARQMQRWLWAGAAATLGLILFDAIRYEGRLDTVRREAASIVSTTTHAGDVSEASQKFLAVSGAMNRLDAEIARETGARLYPGTCLHELTRLTPPSVRLTRISFETTAGEMRGSITGYAMPSESGRPSPVAELEAYIAKLAQSPLFQNVALSGVQATTIRERDAQRFDARFLPVAVPLSPTGIVSASAADDGAAVGGPMPPGGAGELWGGTP